MTDDSFFDLGPLHGPTVHLAPLLLGHVPDLVAAAKSGRERFTFTDVPADVVGMRAYVERAVAAGESRQAVPFVVIRAADGRIVGTSRFCYFEYWHWRGARPHPPERPDACQIGYTWLAADLHRTGVNREAKWLMLSAAFERWTLARVTFRTDARNLGSRASIEGLGASLDGVLRSEQAAYDGGIRDTAWYSLLDHEWPDAKRRLRRGPNG